MKGGRPKGSTKKAKRELTLAEKKAVNFVCVEYAELQDEKRKELGKSKSKKNIKLPNGTRKRLISEAKERFGVTKKDFNVPKQTSIESRQTN